MPLPLICPQQSNPPIGKDSDLFGRLWYLFFYNLTQSVLGLPGTNKHLTATPDPLLDLVLTTALQDVAGGSVMLNIDGFWQVTGQFNLQNDGAGGSGPAEGFLTVGDVVDYNPCEIGGDDSNSGVTSCTGVYQVRGATEAKMQALKVVNAGVAHCFGYGSRIIAVYLHP